MKIGKLPNALLEKLILRPVREQSPPIQEVLAGPSIGEDCALLDFGGDDILISTDPITATEDNIGRLLVTVCVNDIAASGGKPVGLTVTALLPPSVTEDSIKRVMEDLLDEAKKQNVAILGGHTEITDAVNRIVLSGTVLGRVEKGGCIKTDGARPNDKIVMTKSAGLEGAAILSHSFDKQLMQKFGREFVERAKKFSDMTSITKEAEIAKSFGASSMHDITEGGLLGALSEASLACGFGFEADLRNVSVSDEVKEICGFFAISPYELISSGSLLITAKNGEALVSELEKNGFEASVIGVVSETDTKSYIVDLGGKRRPINPPQADAIYDAMRLLPDKAGEDTVLFVCTGNTCRSPMAEAVAKSIAEENNLRYTFISRGLFAENGVSASENSIKAMSEKGIDLSEFKSAPLTEKDVGRSILILTMTNSHKQMIIERFAEVTGIKDKVFTLPEYACGIKKDITDPFGRETDYYRVCAGEIEKYVNEAIRKLGSIQ